MVAPFIEADVRVLGAHYVSLAAWNSAGHGGTLNPAPNGGVKEPVVMNQQDMADLQRP